MPPSLPRFASFLLARAEPRFAAGYTPWRYSAFQRARRSPRSVPYDGVIKVEMHFRFGYLRAVRLVQKASAITGNAGDWHSAAQDHPRSAGYASIEEAREFFDAVPALARSRRRHGYRGLTYIRLGQSAVDAASAARPSA